MIHPKIVRDGPMMLSGPDPLQDALELRAQIRGLKALLDLQRWQIEVLTDKLYSTEPAGTAARRLLALKQSEARARHKVEIEKS
jgi:ribonuclease HI